MIFKLLSLLKHDPKLIDGIISTEKMFQKRNKIPWRLVIHHSAGWDMRNEKPDQVRLALSDTGRGQWKEWAGHDNTYHIFPDGWPCWCNYHYAVYPYNGGWRMIQLVKYPISEILWHAGDEQINAESIGICILGDYTNREVDERAFKEISRILKWYNTWLNTKGKGLLITGHMDHMPTGCPGKIYNQLQILRNLIGYPAS